MKIISLELYKYKRLSLNNTTYFKITLVELLQLIVGTNGSGKSSLLKELSPLPAAPNDYAKDGYKVIELTHQLHHYTLKSVFSPKQEHSFIVDNGDNLNKGGTASVQRELIKQHLGITPDIHALMIGTKQFTKMSSADRRQWFTDMSDVDYNYAISVYQKIREQYRDTQGAIKLLTVRLVQETAKLLSEQDIRRLNENVLDINNVLQYLVDNKPISVLSLTNIKNNINDNKNNIKELSAKLVSLINATHRLSKYKDIEECDSATIQTESKLIAAKNKKDDLLLLADNKLNILNAIKQTNLADTCSIFSKLENIDSTIKIIEDKIKYKLPWVNPSLSINALETIYDELVDIFSVLSINSDKTLGRAGYNAQSEIIIANNNNLAKIKQQLNNLQSLDATQEHLLTHNATECPNCNYKWSREYDSEKHQRIKRDIEHYVSELKILEDKNNKDQAKLDYINSYINLYVKYTQLCKSWPILNPIWSYFYDNSIVLDKPQSIPSLLDVIRADLNCYLEVATLTKQADELRTLSTATKEQGNVSVVNLTEDIIKLENEIYMLDLNIKFLNETSIDIKVTRDRWKTLQNVIQTLTESLNGVGKLKEDAEVILKRDAINTLITDLNVKRVMIEHQLSASLIQQGIIKNLEEQLSNYATQEANLKTLMAGLSPTDGLIAMMLSGFINSFVKQMNTFIASVWQYPLKVLACGVDTDNTIELDYKFGLKVNNSEAVADVSMGSSAMQEIVDLAFKLVAMHYLGLSEAPVYLDEFGKTFDLAHRKSATNIISNLMNTCNVTQVFMVSHYADSYGSLKNSATVALCTANIIIPKDTIVNKHVVLK